MIYADTSFIASCYLTDVHTPQALIWLEKNQPRLPFIFLHWPEMAKAITAASANSEKDWEALREDVGGGVKFTGADADANRIARRAAGLLRNFYPRWKKLRSLDAMHVAAAVEIGSKIFLSFDTNSYQRVLAKTQKLEIWPPLTDEEKSRLK